MPLIFVLLADVIHVYIFLWKVFCGENRAHKTFGVTPSQAEQNRLFAFNQATVLLFSQRKLARAAVVQGLPPLIGLVLFALQGL